METIEKKLEENQSLITEAESYFIASTKEVEIAKEEIEIEIVDKMLILQGIVSKKYPLDFADINLAKIKKWIKEGKTIEGVEVKKIPIYKFKAFKEKK